MSRVEQFLLGSGHNRTAIHIGLVNNMPDAMLRTTELQFARLLKDAAGPLDVRLRLFSLRSIPRSVETRGRMAGFYDDAAFLEAADIDALIVTGAQSGAADMRQEPYWAELTGLIDWAQTGTISTLFSGLAAQAAVLHLDGIAHRPLTSKLSGVYDSRQAAGRSAILQCRSHGAGAAFAPQRYRRKRSGGKRLSRAGAPWRPWWRW